MKYPTNDVLARFVKNGIAAQKAAEEKMPWYKKPCGYDGSRKRLPDGRCAACGRTLYEGGLEKIADNAGKLLEALNTEKQGRAANALRRALLEVGPR